ncbi:MAG: sugar phosphate isomerase/epimerase [Sedimentisphaerales bacterium]|nr:sugar phosphate isomerase/epimerase [Sedimentisphaerales bacterium]
MQEDRGNTAKAKTPLPVGLQLYSVRADCARDLPGTVAAVAKMGYDGVEFAGYYEYSAQDLRKLLDDHGLKCCGTHTAMETLSDENLEATIEFNRTLGNKYLIVPWLTAEGPNPAETWRRYADRFNVLAEKVKPHGMVVGYHSHAHDFTPIDGVMPWDILFGNTSKDVVMQIDTCNTMSGGGDPVAFLKRYPGRSLTIHIKEYSATNPNAIIGEGDVKWDEIFTLCETIGNTRWYIIEEEKDAYPPLTAVDLCLKNYRKLRA